MRLQEAIKLLADDVRRKGNPSFAGINQAQQLGIEALEAIDRTRQKPFILSYEALDKLPSETEGGDE